MADVALVDGCKQAQVQAQFDAKVIQAHRRLQCRDQSLQLSVSMIQSQMTAIWMTQQAVELWVVWVQRVVGRAETHLTKGLQLS